MSLESLKARSFACGTRGAYVRGCRCAPCTASNAAYQADRLARRDALEVEQRPVANGPPVTREFMRLGHTYRLPTCPGLNGRECVAGGAWLKGRRNVERGYCASCLERATIFNGLVPAAEVRAHLIALRRKGVGKVAIATTANVSGLVIAQLCDGKRTRLRAATARRLLDIDESCRLDGSLVPAAKTQRMIKGLFAKGLTHRQIAKLMKWDSPQCQPKGQRFVQFSTQHRIERLWKKVVAKEITAERAFVDAMDEWDQLRELVRIGMCCEWLRERTGIIMRFPERRARMRPTVLARVRELLDKIDGMPRSERALAWPRYRGEWPKHHDRKRTT